MPIYAYRCASCGHRKDVLQKLSDPHLTECPSCHAQAFSRQVSAPAFQLKGSGWYVTDFRDGNKGGKTADKPADKPAGGDAPAAKPADAAAAPASSPAPAPAPAAASSPSPSTS